MLSALDATDTWKDNKCRRREKEKRDEVKER
jgi:hypothetical protein